MRLHPESVGLQAMDPGSRPVLLITSLLPLTKAGQSVRYNIKLTVPRVLNSKGYRLVKVKENHITAPSASSPGTKLAMFSQHRGPRDFLLYYLFWTELHYTIKD